jgi:glucose-1-phosphate thymidylyltransferase
MRLTGVTKTYIVLRPGKWDIPAYLGDGEMLNMHLAYLMMHLPFGAPYTIDQAYPFVRDALVAFGFPDIIFKPDNAFVKLMERQTETNADIVLGVFPVNKPQKWDMVDIHDDGRIEQVLIKPIKTDLQYTWIIAVWTPAFTHFMHKYLSTLQEVREQANTGSNVSEQRELYVGDVIQAAIDNNLQVEGVIFPDSTCLDIGTTEDLVKAVYNMRNDIRRGD